MKNKARPDVLHTTDKIRPMQGKKHKVVEHFIVTYSIEILHSVHEENCFRPKNCANNKKGEKVASTILSLLQVKQQFFLSEIKPKSINVRTRLGTTLWICFHLFKEIWLQKNIVIVIQAVISVNQSFTNVTSTDHNETD